MTEPRYEPGEIIDIVIRDAMVIERRTGTLTYEYTTIGGGVPVVARAAVESWADSVTIRRVLPAGGMPKPGELWETADGTRLLALQHGDEVRLTDGRTGHMTVSVAHGSYGPIRRVYPEPDGGESR